MPVRRRGTKQRRQRTGRRKKAEEGAAGSSSSASSDDENSSEGDDAGGGRKDLLPAWTTTGRGARAASGSSRRVTYGSAGGLPSTTADEVDDNSNGANNSAEEDPEAYLDEDAEEAPEDEEEEEEEYEFQDDSNDEDFCRNSSAGEEEDSDLDDAAAAGVDYDDKDDIGVALRKRRQGKDKSSAWECGSKKKKSKIALHGDGSCGSDSSDAGEEDEEEEEGMSSRGRRRRRRSPTRKSAERANRKLADLKDDGDDEDEAPTVARKGRARANGTASKKKKADADDEDFEESSFENDQGGDDSDILSSSEYEEEERENGVGIVRDDDIGTDEDSSSSDRAGAASVARKGAPPRSRRVGRNRGKAKQPSIFDESSSSEDDDDADTNGRVAHPQVDSPPKCPTCPSTADAITEEDLPAMHVCFCPPDGRSRNCFSLDTLRKIVLVAKEQDTAVRKTDGRLQFLQPPHFRTVMSDDLQDQIASRFGREALDVEGPYYQRDTSHRPKLRPGETWESSSTYVDPAFKERVNRYVKSVMGSRDLYACPLCYTAVYNKIDGIASRSRTADVTKRYNLEFDLDPMSILTGESLPAASTFCFNSQAKLKHHLRDGHDIDTKVVTGNELYKRFQVRTQDGLLQRYIKRQLSGDALQGHLQSYWLSGNNHDFVHLLDLVDTLEYYQGRRQSSTRNARNARYDDEDDESSTNSALDDALEKGNELRESIAHDADELWDYISGPYQCNNGDDVADFIAGEDEGDASGDDEQEALTHRELDMQEERNNMKDAEELFERYRKMDEDEKKNEDGDSDDDSEGELEFVSNEDGDVDDGGEFEEEAEEEEDDWMAKRQQSMQKRFSRSGRKRRGSSSASRRESRSAGTPAAARRPRKPSDDPDDDDEGLDFAAQSKMSSSPSTNTCGSRKKRLSIQDSDDDE